MTSNECVEKLRSILKKINYGWFVVSDDTDCECDFGVDGNGNLVICGVSTFFELKDLECITYHDDLEMEIDEAFIHFSFVENNDLYIYYDHDHCTCIGDKFSIYMNGYEIVNEVSRKLIYHKEDWNREGDYIINKEGTLLAYIGEEKEVVLPENVKKIGEYAFYSAKTVESIVCSNGMTEISDNAFFGCCPLNKIDLKNVEIIGECAFGGRELTEIIIPSSVKTIGKEAFYVCKEELVNNITNNSSVIIDDSIIRVSRK